MSELKQLATEIAAHGNRAVFGITGSGATLTVLDQLEKLGVEPVRTYFEGSAALMAGTVGRLTGRAGVVYGIKGPGLANMASGLAASWFEAFPLIALAEAYGPNSSAGKIHKKLDQQALTSVLTKGGRYFSAQGPSFAQLAQWAEAEIPGPVLLQLAGDGMSRQPPVPELPAGAAEDAVVLSALERAQRPVVIAGTYAARAGFCDQLAKLRIPVFSTAAAKGVLDETSSMAAGIFTGVGLQLTPEQRLLPQADLIVGIGLRPNECLATRPFACASVNIDCIDAPGSSEFAFSAVGGASPQFWSLLQSKAWGEDLVADSIARLRGVMLDAFLPGRAFDAIAKVLGANVRMVMDTGNFCTVGEHCWQASRWNHCLLAGQGRYMGTAIPMALAAGIQEPQVPVVAVAGDGGIAMYLAEVRLAVERRLPILFILMSDGQYGSIAGRAIKEGLTLAPIRFANPSWLAVMQGLGMPGWRAANEQDLGSALESWQPAAGPGYLEIAFDPDAYQNISAGIR